MDVVSPSIPRHRPDSCPSHPSHPLPAERVQGCAVGGVAPSRTHPLRPHPCTCHASRSLTTLRAALPPHREQALAHVSGLGFGKPARSRHKAAARLDLDVYAGWASPSSCGLWGGDALLLSTRRCWKPNPGQLLCQADVPPQTSCQSPHAPPDPCALPVYV